MTSAGAGAGCDDTLASTDPMSGVRSILVPVDGSPASMDAITLACSIAKKNKGKVYAVHVIEVRRSLPLDAELTDDATNGEDVLIRAERVANNADFKIEGELLQARVAVLIASTGNTIANIATVGGVLPNNPIATTAASLTTQIAGYTQKV